MVAELQLPKIGLYGQPLLCTEDFKLWAWGRRSLLMCLVWSANDSRSGLQRNTFALSSLVHVFLQTLEWGEAVSSPAEIHGQSSRKGSRNGNNKNHAGLEALWTGYIWISSVHGTHSPDGPAGTHAQSSAMHPQRATCGATPAQAPGYRVQWGHKTSLE